MNHIDSEAVGQVAVEFIVTTLEPEGAESSCKPWLVVSGRGIVLMDADSIILEVGLVLIAFL